MKTEKDVAELARELRRLDNLICADTDCKNCIFDRIADKTLECSHYKMAYTLIKRDGYRKIKPTDTFITKKGYMKLIREERKVRKETAEAVITEIWATLIVNNEGNTETFDYYYTIETIKEIAKRYGVEDKQ